MNSDLPNMYKSSNGLHAGNHELDNGIKVLKERIAETNFPWLLSNVDDRRTEKPLANCARFHVLQRAGLTIGLIGLASIEWIATLNLISPEDVIYTAFIDTARKLSHILRRDHNCQIVIALTHMRVGDDEALATARTGVDLILGGHDHIVWKRLVNGVWCLKSGTDFKTYSTIDLYTQPSLDGSDDDDVTVVTVEPPVVHSVTSAVEPDRKIAAFCAERMRLLGEDYFEVVANCPVTLDGRFVSIRTSETALGNFACDVLAYSLHTPIALLNSGSFRSDTDHPAGEVTRRTIDTILPFQDETIVTRCSAALLLSVLENSVSQYPLLDGRFCQVSGVSFVFDALKPKGARVDRASVRCRHDVGGSLLPLEDGAELTLAIKTYMFNGKDGFPLGNVSNIVQISEETLPTMILKYLQSLPRSGDDAPPVIEPAVSGRIVCLHQDSELNRYYHEHHHHH